MTDSNVDQAEVSKFNALASRWWDPMGDFRPLHELNPLRADYIAKFSQLAGSRAIDIGCGGGILTESLARAGAKVTGIDMSEAPLAVAKIHAGAENLEISYEQTTAEAKAAVEPEQYDLVCCLEMLEHVPDPSSVVRSCATLAKPGARLYFSTINRNPKSFLFAIVGAEYVLRLLPRGTHEYRKLIKPSELHQWCRDAGLEVEETLGVQFNPLTHHFSTSERDVSVNYMIRCRKAGA